MTKLCHINLLKPDYTSSLGKEGGRAERRPVGLVTEGVLVAAEDGVGYPYDAILQSHNSKKLAELGSWVI